MYEAFYGFKKKPFQLLPDAQFFFRSKKHDAALTYLEYGIYERTGFVLITGEVGTGKTTLLNYLLQTLRNRKDVSISFLSQTYLTPEEFLRTLCQEFSLPYQARTKSELIEIFGNYLVREYRSNRYVILIIDEAQNLPFETLEEIRMLSNLNAGSEHLLQIILVGQPGLRDKLQKDTLRQLTQRIEVSYHLEALDLEETKEYVRFRLERAEGNTDIFTDDAIEEIYAYSKGIPRVINAVCNMCLVYGMADELKKIDRDVVLSVLKDRKDWELTPKGEETHISPDGTPSISFEGIDVGLKTILESLDSKLDVFLNVAQTSKVLLEEIVSRLPQNRERGNGLSRIENILLAGLEHQKKTMFTRREIGLIIGFLVLLMIAVFGIFYFRLI